VLWEANVAKKHQTMNKSSWGWWAEGLLQVVRR